jgi:ADP-ribosyl-[dinitrogen reductase] hydrolase
MPDVRDRFRGCLVGLAVGDAVGTTVEFQPRGSFAPLTDMSGGGPFRLEPGKWTDDTSMALCLAESLVERGFDLSDQIERYCRWFEQGYWSSIGRCFDIGNTTRAALERYRATGEVIAGIADSQSAGNGCIMRLAPVPMHFFPDEDEAAEYSARSCVTTHAAPECLDSARALGRAVVRGLGGASKDDVIAVFAASGFVEKSESEVRGSGYVVDCLEAAVWCFANTDSFESAVLRAANLGDDADTTAAVCGQIAGAFYGERGIPSRWLSRLHLVDEIRALADRLARPREPIGSDPSQ